MVETLSPSQLEILKKGEFILTRQRAFNISQGTVPDHSPGTMDENWKHAVVDFEKNEYCLGKLAKLHDVILQMRRRENGNRT